MKEIGKTIASLRMENGLRQKDLSRILNLSPSSISNYETGAYWPDLNTLCGMADYFSVTTDYLLGRTEYRCPPEILGQYFAKDYVIPNIINTLLSLDSASVTAAVKYLDYLKESHKQMPERLAAGDSESIRKAPSRPPHKTSVKNDRNGRT